MKRVLVSSIPEPGQVARVDSAESHHLLKVRRVAPGEMLEVMDGSGGLALGELLVEGRQALVRIEKWVEEKRESPLRLSVGLAIPSQLSVVDQFLPGMVQLGVTHVYLAPTAFGGRPGKRAEKYEDRLNSICLQSLKQCGRTQAPELMFLPNWDRLCRTLVENHQRTILFHPAEAEVSMEVKPESLALLIGPEGGFSPEEVDHARHLGIECMGLGPRILKMETAVIGACFWAQRAFGDLF